MRVLTFVLILFVLASCKTTQYVPVETVKTSLHTDSVTQLITRLMTQQKHEREKETVYMWHDRVITVNENGDTVKDVERSGTDRTRELEREVSVLKAENDSLRHLTESKDTARVEVPVPYPVEKIKEVNVLHWWQTALMWLGGVAGVVLGVMIWRGRRK